MKNLIFISGIILILLNCTFGLILQDYPMYKMLFSNISIACTTGLIYALYSSTINDGFKIGLSVAFVITGCIRFLFSLTSSESIKENNSIILFLVVLAIEAILFALANALRNK